MRACLGVGTLVVAIIRLGYVLRVITLSSENNTSSNIPMFQNIIVAVSMVEGMLAMVSVCLPSFRVLITKKIRRLDRTSANKITVTRNVSIQLASRSSSEERGSLGDVAPMRGNYFGADHGKFNKLQGAGRSGSRSHR